MITSCAVAAAELDVSADACVQVGMMVQTIAWTSRAGVGNTEKCWFKVHELEQKLYPVSGSHLKVPEGE